VSFAGEVFPSILCLNTFVFLRIDALENRACSLLNSTRMFRAIDIVKSFNALFQTQSFRVRISQFNHVLLFTSASVDFHIVSVHAVIFSTDITVRCGQQMMLNG